MIEMMLQTASQLVFVLACGTLKSAIPMWTTLSDVTLQTRAYYRPRKKQKAFQRPLKGLLKCLKRLSKGFLKASKRLKGLLEAFKSLAKGLFNNCLKIFKRVLKVL